MQDIFHYKGLHFLVKYIILNLSCCRSGAGRAESSKTSQFIWGTKSLLTCCTIRNTSIAREILFSPFFTTWIKRATCEGKEYERDRKSLPKQSVEHSNQSSFWCKVQSKGSATRETKVNDQDWLLSRLYSEQSKCSHIFCVQCESFFF